MTTATTIAGVAAITLGAVLPAHAGVPVQMLGAFCVLVRALLGARTRPLLRAPVQRAIAVVRPRAVEPIDGRWARTAAATRRAVLVGDSAHPIGRAALVGGAVRAMQRVAPLVDLDHVASTGAARHRDLTRDRPRDSIDDRVATDARIHRDAGADHGAASERTHRDTSDRCEAGSTDDQVATVHRPRGSTDDAIATRDASDRDHRDATVRCHSLADGDPIPGRGVRPSEHRTALRRDDGTPGRATLHLCLVWARPGAPGHGRPRTLDEIAADADGGDIIPARA